MAQAFILGWVTSSLELKTSVKNNPYVMFSLAEHIGFGETARTQYIQVWAWGHLAQNLVNCNVAKDSLIWASGTLELSDYTRKDNGARDKRLKLTLKDWGFLPGTGRTRPKPTSQTGALHAPIVQAPAAEVIDGERDQLPE